MRYEQPVTPIAVFLQQIVRPLGMNDDRCKSVGVYLSEASFQPDIVIRILRNRFMDIDYAFFARETIYMNGKSMELP